MVSLIEQNHFAARFLLERFYALTSYTETNKEPRETTDMKWSIMYTKNKMFVTTKLMSNRQAGEITGSEMRIIEGYLNGAVYGFHDSS